RIVYRLVQVGYLVPEDISTTVAFSSFQLIANFDNKVEFRWKIVIGPVKKQYSAWYIERSFFRLVIMQIVPSQLDFFENTLILSEQPSKKRTWHILFRIDIDSIG